MCLYIPGMQPWKEFINAPSMSGRGLSTTSFLVVSSTAYVLVWNISVVQWSIQLSHCSWPRACSESFCSYPSAACKALRLGVVAAKKIILLVWKFPNLPCFKKWLNKITNIIQMERMHLHDSKAKNYFFHTFFTDRLLTISKISNL